MLLDVDDSACFRPSAKSSQTKRRGTTEHASVLHSNAPRVLTETEGGQRDIHATIGQTPVRAPGESYSLSENFLVGWRPVVIHCAA